jgi:hypothetical protein
MRAFRQDILAKMAQQKSAAEGGQNPAAAGEGSDSET